MYHWFLFFPHDASRRVPSWLVLSAVSKVLETRGQAVELGRLAMLITHESLKVTESQFPWIETWSRQICRREWPISVQGYHFKGPDQGHCPPQVHSHYWVQDVSMVIKSLRVPKLRYQWFLCLFSPVRRVLVTAGEPVQRGAGVEWDSSPAILDLPIYPTPFPFCPALLGRRDEQTPQPNPCCGVKAWLTQDQAASFPSAFWLDGRLGRHLFLKKRLWNVCYSLELQRKEAGLGYVPEAGWRGGDSETDSGCGHSLVPSRITAGGNLLPAAQLEEWVVPCISHPSI